MTNIGLPGRLLHVKGVQLYRLVYHYRSTWPIITSQRCGWLVYHHRPTRTKWCNATDSLQYLQQVCASANCSLKLKYCSNNLASLCNKTLENLLSFSGWSRTPVDNSMLVSCFAQDNSPHICKAQYNKLEKWWQKKFNSRIICEK